MPYRIYEPSKAPAWLQRPIGNAWFAARGDSKDATVERCKSAVKCRFPRLAPEDALEALGRERGIDRLPSEGRANYAERVRGAWAAWSASGTALGLLRALSDAGYPTACLVIPGGKGYRLSNGELVIVNLPTGSWCVDFSGNWAQFQVLFPLGYHPWGVRFSPNSIASASGGVVTIGNHPTHSGRVTVDVSHVYTQPNANLLELEIYVYDLDGNAAGWGYGEFTVPTASPTFLDSSLVSGWRYDLTFSTAGGAFQVGDHFEFYFYAAVTPPATDSDEVNRLRSIVRRWKPAFARCSGIVVQTTGILMGMQDPPLGNLTVTDLDLTGNAATMWAVD